jgi:hypothetical protein
MQRLGVGFIGSGFITRFHLQSWQAVRDADVLGIWSPNSANAAATAAYARDLGIGATRAYGSITAMIADPAIDALWICGPNHRRVENLEEIVAALESGKGGPRHRLRKAARAQRRRGEALRGADPSRRRAARLSRGPGLRAASLDEGPLAGWKRGASITGRPYLARAAEEHSGPHMPWFWQGRCRAAACSTT